MRIEGKRIRCHRWVHTERYVVSVEVEAVVPEDDPGESCFESETVQLLREVDDRAKHGDVDWLKQHGTVYEIVDAA